jgi:hypothetical protein
MLRLKQRQKTIISALRGFFATALAANTISKFVEIVGNQTSVHAIKAEYFFDAVAVLGERVGALRDCRLVAHSQIISALRKQDENDFVIASMNGSLGLDTYKGCPIIYSDTLSRAGTTSGTVYDTYLLAPGSVGWGEKAQSTSVGDVASMTIKADEATNNLTLYDRTRFLVHPVGAKWVGSPAGQSATNAELATAANYELAYTSASRVGMVRILTNG